MTKAGAARPFTFLGWGIDVVVARTWGARVRRVASYRRATAPRPSYGFVKKGDCVTSHIGALRIVDPEAFEREIRRVMQEADGSIPVAAKSLGVSARQLSRWLTEIPDIPRKKPGRPWPKSNGGLGVMRNTRNIPKATDPRIGEPSTGTGEDAQHRRVLDMLAGWMLYVGGFLDHHPCDAYQQEHDAIHDLYQRVGALRVFTIEDFDDTLKEVSDIIRMGGKSNGE